MILESNGTEGQATRYLLPQFSLSMIASVRSLKIGSTPSSLVILRSARFLRLEADMKSSLGLLIFLVHCSTATERPWFEGAIVLEPGPPQECERNKQIGRSASDSCSHSHVKYLCHEGYSKIRARSESIMWEDIPLDHTQYVCMACAASCSCILTGWL